MQKLNTEIIFKKIAFGAGVKRPTKEGANHQSINIKGFSDLL